MKDFWWRILEGRCAFGTGILLGLGALTASLLLLAFVLRPIVQLLSARDTEKVRRGRVRRLSFSMFLAAVTWAFFVFLHSTIPVHVRHTWVMYELTQLFFILFTSYTAFEIVLTLFAVYLPQLRGGSAISPIYQDIVRTFVYFGLILYALKQAFPSASIGTLLTTSAILSVVLGLALQESLSNIFSGLTISIDRPFKPGDWLLIEGQEGKVIDSNWRSTRLLNRDNDTIHLPNSLVAKGRFINYAQPSGLHLCRRNLSVELGAQPNKVRAVLVDMMHHVDGVLREPQADVFTLEYGSQAATYELRFWISDFDRRTKIESDVLRGAWYHLKRNHVRIAMPTQDLYLRRDAVESSPDATMALLRKVDILQPLQAEDLRMLAEDLRSQLFATGEVICRQGEMGATFYILRTGLVSVRVSGSEVTRLKPGDFFGEVSLLTGEPRNSTIVAVEDVEVFCLDRESFSTLLSENPTVAKAMSEVIAKRSAAAKEKAAAETGASKAQGKSDEATHILEKIWTIFGFRS